jgi:hypothetical protein
VILEENGDGGLADAPFSDANHQIVEGVAADN